MSKRKQTPNVMSELQGLGKASTSPPSASAQPPDDEMRSNAAKSTPKSRLAGRATYDIGFDLKEAIRRESIHLGIPASQLARYLLLYAWDDYANNDIPSPTLLPSDSPAYRNVIDFSA